MEEKDHKLFILTKTFKALYEVCKCNWSRACLAQDAKLIGLSLVQMDNAAALKDDLLS